MIEKFIYLFKKEKMIPPLMKGGKRLLNAFNFTALRTYTQRKKKENLVKKRKSRVLDAIHMEKEPDMVPVIGNGINFFPAKYTGISCESYMYEKKSFLNATMQVVEDFDLDMHFGSFL